jgi:hypothetical protein
MAQPISNLSVGAKVKSPDTKYNGVPIVWQVGHKTVDRVKLITERIITFKCFDAKEPSNPDSGRQNYGNNRYSVSNIDQWLNSTAGPGAWYSARHTYDAPPNNANVWDGYNEYDAEAGFPANFEESFRNAILDTTIRVVKPPVDGGAYEDITRKVYLLSRTEVGLGNENGIAEGSKWDLFSDDNSRKAYPTAEAVSASEYTYLTWNWWLRTPRTDSSRDAGHVHPDGVLDLSSAHNGRLGVRPALELDSGILVSDTPDIDGAYIIQWGAMPTLPNLKVYANGIKAYKNGWAKVNGQLKRITAMWTKINGQVKKI